MLTPFRNKSNASGAPSPRTRNTSNYSSTTGHPHLVARGTFWLFVQMLGTKAIMLGGQMVLAWLLSKEDFGQIAMAYTVSTFVAVLINPGIDVILIQRGRKFHLWSTPAFYFSLATGFLGCFVIIAASPLVARIYGTPQLSGLLTVLALATPLGSLMLVPTAKLRYEMRFKETSVVNLIQTLVQTGLTLAFAASRLRRLLICSADADCLCG